MSFCEIDHGVPLPARYPWLEMQVGDSIRLSNPKDFHRAKCAAYEWSKKHPPYAFTSRVARLRIWRIK